MLIPINLISKITGLSNDEIKKLKNTNLTLENENKLIFDKYNNLLIDSTQEILNYQMNHHEDFEDIDAGFYNYNFNIEKEKNKK